ncbi:LPXTG cell wall anchor domain-containing protein [Streptomyces sp. NPDC052773]|uniref:LPXTG cell wall anchor domain-containing protein n=1 Tax=Streptomyces sp. NPDC052773 TaxID=3365693 RepID=UPI0037D2CD3D
MKLRRAMAAAAATAAIAPLALLSAPAAFATEDTSSASPSVTATETVSESATPTPTASASETAPEPTGSATETSPAPTGSATETSPAPTGSATETSPAPTGSATGSASPSPSPSESAEPDPICADPGDESVGLSDDLRSGLSGLADTIVAGSGWEQFSFDVSNRGDEEIKDIKPLIGVAAIGWDEQDYSGEITVQVRDKASGTWSTIANTGGEGGTFPAFSLGAGQSISFEMRLSVSGEVPDAIGLTGGFAQYADEEGCWIADDPNGWLYFFDILAAGSEAPKPGDAKPQTGGMADLDDVNSVDVTGSLAETGAGSALPMIGLVGGAAVVAGAGAVYIVRRKKAEA